MMVRDPESGPVKTRLAPAFRPAAAAVLYRGFVEDLCAALGARFRLVLACTPSTRSPFFDHLAARYRLERLPQGEGDLGARMRRAAVAGLAIARRVVVIGSDAPTLPPEFVARAFAALRTHRVVLGPSLDGGYYLVGMRTPVPPIFARMRWSDAGVLARTLRRLARARIPYALLPCWYDVDTPADVDLLRRHLTTLAGAGERPCPRTRRALRALSRRRTAARARRRA
jgi:rSAM/selenodomain-associated transferase 1